MTTIRVNVLIPVFMGWFARAANRCALCKENINASVAVPNPDAIPFITGKLSAINCQQVHNFLEARYTDDNITCKWLRGGAADICGCEIPVDACHICADGSRVANLTHKIDVTRSEFGFPYSPFSKDNQLNCKNVESQTLYRVKNNSKRCFDYQQRFAEECGCPQPPPSLPGEYNFTEDDNSDTEILRPTFNRRCTICKDGGQILYPERKFDWTYRQFNFSSCFQLQSLELLIDWDKHQCPVGVQMFGSYCGCEEMFLKPEKKCNLCANGSPPRYPLKNLRWNKEELLRYFNFPITEFKCGMFDSVMENYDEDAIGFSEGIFCLLAQFRSGYCGCEFDWKPVMIVWCFRISGLFSIVGSSLILYSIFQPKYGKIKNTYHQILVGLSLFDICSSSMYVLSTIMTPVKDGLYGAIGNVSSCKVQGFLFQLGLTSAFFNALLATYFYLVVRNWREDKFRKYRCYVYVCILILGLTLAITGIPYYNTEFLYCYIRPPPGDKSFFPILFFNVAPIAIVFLILTVSTLLLLHTVYKRHSASVRYSMNNAPNIFQRVLWRSLCYLLSYSITLPIMLIRSFVHLIDKKYMEAPESFLAWSIIIALLSPAQGLFNALVYFARERKVITQIFSVCCCEKEERGGDNTLNNPNEQSTEENSGNTPISGDEDIQGTIEFLEML